ncbi:hypothetical protein M427DRAFT_59349 [Gonapodya prolifera JEL478]|uniref:Uncharacterized protein n=1 Tax=Gonapodya prolifera (strain JEL478) TaxID=1344416 RepID=A0A139A752_GONPJ|nr:hypothetical protein M427DRAFT_59349 [Gonapodya prolifera JEL478]|eukprot:KXS12611.1 hypothetical protein M427DRAFT_59349 [Gonapodya prolifera JEL478]
MYGLATGRSSIHERPTKSARMSQLKSTINDDLEAREFLASLESGIQTIVSFLTKFDAHTRFQINRMEERLSYLERRLTFLESSTVDISTQPDLQSNDMLNG